MLLRGCAYVFVTPSVVAGVRGHVLILWPAQAGLVADAGGNAVIVIVDQSEDLGRIGFSGLLAELDTAPPAPAESPGHWAPGAVSRGAVSDEARVAVDAFCAWLADQRAEVRS